jgi:penicillin-binding protein 2
MVLDLDKDRRARESLESAAPDVNERGGGRLTLSRLNFLKVGVAGSFVLLGWRLMDMQKPFAERTELTAAEIQRRNPVNSQYIVSKAPRGVIYDRKLRQLVFNEVSYAVTITPNFLPDPEKGKTDAEEDVLREQRQAVYDDLARFLGMKYYFGIVPEQVNAMDKKGVFRNPERNALLNELEVLTSISSLDWDKRLAKMSLEGNDKSLLIINQDNPVPIDGFDRYKYLRTKYETNFYFISEAQRKMIEAAFYSPAFQPVEVWSNLSREDAMRLGERRIDFPGVDIKVSYSRRYEDTRLFSHLLGYTGRIQNNDQLERLNRQAEVERPSTANPDDPANKIKVYDIDDRIGVSGVESSMEAALRGRKGANEVKVNATGQIMENVRTGEPPQPGNNVVLTIDWELQSHVANTLEKWIKESYKSYKSNRKPPTFLEGAAVVMDVTNGEVLAMVSFPTFNNNLYNMPRNKWTDNDVKELLDEEKAVEISRATRARYAPGSCFKLITAAAVLSEGNFSRATTVECRRYIQVPTTKNPTPTDPFRCWGNHGSLNVIGAIENSCDIFFFNASVSDEASDKSGRNRYYFREELQRNVSNNPQFFKGVGISPLNGYMELFNIGKPTGIELPGEYRGLLPGPHTKSWSIGDSMTTAIGQNDVEMTPLQVTLMTATIANAGKMFQPRIVREIRDADGNVVTPFEPKLIRDVTKNPVKWSVPDRADPNKRNEREFTIPQGVLQAIRQGMLAVTETERGTAGRVLSGNQLGNLKVAGKTGTAEYGEVIGKDDDGNDARATRAWFTAYAPFDRPKYAITVLIPAGDVGNEGSTFAVPPVKEILEYLYPEESGANKRREEEKKKEQGNRP